MSLVSLRPERPYVTKHWALVGRERAVGVTVGVVILAVLVAIGLLKFRE
jgi:hypothetical protein